MLTQQQMINIEYQRELGRRMLEEAATPGHTNPPRKSKPRTDGARYLAIKFIIERDGPTCYLCGTPVDHLTGQIEHIIPMSRGGSNEPHNVAVACEPCNRDKAEFAVSIDVDRRPRYHRIRA